MVRRASASKTSGYTILLVDDSAEYLESARRLLEREGHAVLTASDGPTALALLRATRVDLMLLDYYMPGMNGEEVVRRVRAFNPFVQVVLATGYASEQPARELLRRLEIQGYYDKSEGPDKLLLWTDAALKVAYTVQLLNHSRQGLRYILEVTPELHRIQPLEELLRGILHQICGLLYAVDAFVALLPDGRAVVPPSADGFVAMVEGETDLVVRVGTGSFEAGTPLDGCLPPERMTHLRSALQRGDIEGDEFTVVPLRVGDMTFGVVYLDRRIQSAHDLELLRLFANQAAVAIHNIQLYEMATVDPLTGVYVRRFFDQILLREVRSAFRNGAPLTLLMVDVDNLKQINDTVGHLAGDQALVQVGAILARAIRGGDLVARYGGDEFAVILPATSAEHGGDRVAARLFEQLAAHVRVRGFGKASLSFSVGMAELEPAGPDVPALMRPTPSEVFTAAAEDLVKEADKALYAAKRGGGGRLIAGERIGWRTTVER